MARPRAVIASNSHQAEQDEAREERLMLAPAGAGGDDEGIKATRAAGEVGSLVERDTDYFTVEEEAKKWKGKKYLR
eukprot:CAMPEP_0174904404 /NCGR_PEP_ID=MMETSP0167-20121228/48478_1 /TAXON_ID=38298 /ORGANISM="Rhodella maculata, Strain CCMP736" /LENGTH=75 /DNA_ID=CAMNT_0016147041 /DNA_START=1629 /DNA_END=1855 /DNA_ORIENTATION=-